MDFERGDFRYTALFCEENVWWLTHDLVGQGVSFADLWVLVFSNPTRSILMSNQRAALPGRPVAWDYHVVLVATVDGLPRVFDFDSRLSFPVTLTEYLAASFPPQAMLPPSYRTEVRVVPAAGYLARLYSDRSHMAGRVPRSAFPAYPVIQPAPGISPITLARYLDMRAELDDDSRVLGLEALRASGWPLTAA